ncbi:MAG: hypothetical protein ACRDON_07190 [Gaiellaceae bacterium]
MLRRRLVVAFFAAVAVALAATPAWGKEGVEATLETSIPLNASPSQQLRVAWTLAYRDEQGKRRPFGAGGVFIRLVSASGGNPTTAVASGDGSRTGGYEATVVVPEGGIGGIAIGLHGISSGPDGSSPSDLYFPVKNNPLPPPALAQLDASSDATPNRPSDSSSKSAASTRAIVLALTLLLALGCLALVLRNRKRISAPAARRP